MMNLIKTILLMLFILTPSHGQLKIDNQKNEQKKSFFLILDNFQDIVILKSYSQEDKKYTEREYLRKSNLTNEAIEDIILKPYLESIQSIPQLCLLGYKPKQINNNMIMLTSGSIEKIVIDNVERPFVTISLAELKAHFGQ